MTTRRNAEALANAQHGALARLQLRSLGWTDAAIDAHIAAKRWQRPLPGILVIFTGPMPQGTRLWVALLHCGEGAVLARNTAADLYGFGPQDTRFIDRRIHLSIPATRQVAAPQHTVVRRSRKLAGSTTSHKGFPVTTPERTVLDLVDGAATAKDAIGWITRACQSRAVRAPKLLEALDGEVRFLRRSLVLATCGDVSEGAESVLEVSYLRNVERAHGLPNADRQVSRWTPEGWMRRDVHYRRFHTFVELDGRKGHDGPDDRFRDRWRDNEAATQGQVTVRLGYEDVFGDPCGTAVVVARVLHAQGWSGRTRACGSGCLAARAG